MIAYFDTSALVSLVISEPSSETCGHIWDGADTVVGTRLVYVEASAAVAQAERMDRLSTSGARTSRGILEELWSAITVIELDQHLMVEAGRLAKLHALRGYDAVHCAAAVLVNDADLIGVSGDRRLLAGWRAEGVTTIDPFDA